MSTVLVPLAILMGLATYPSRAIPLLAPGMQRLPARVRLYLRLVGPAVLAALAAVNTMVVIDDGAPPELPRRRRVARGRPCASRSSRWRRSLLLGLVLRRGADRDPPGDGVRGHPLTTATAQVRAAPRPRSPRAGR